MRGRKPKPTRLKVLTGNPGKHPLNQAEPRPEPAIPDCPPELSEAAKREWQRLVGELGQLRILTNLDRAALAAYCNAYALWAEATEAIQQYGVMVKSPTGFPIQSPYLSIAKVTRSRCQSSISGVPSFVTQMEHGFAISTVSDFLRVGNALRGYCLDPDYRHAADVDLTKLGPNIVISGPDRARMRCTACSGTKVQGIFSPLGAKGYYRGFRRTP